MVEEEGYLRRAHEWKGQRLEHSAVVLHVKGVLVEDHDKTGRNPPIEKCFGVMVHREEPYCMLAMCLRGRPPCSGNSTRA